MSLINREALIAEYDRVHVGAPGGARKLMVDAPEVKPERKTGQWLPDNNNYYEERYICSACKRSYKVDTCMGKPIWNYCPCGAKMEEGDQEEEVLALAIKYGGRGKKKGNENDSGGTEAV